jgi:hypothetical protein
VSTGAQRRPASAVPAIKGLLISPPNATATLVDISSSGLLAEIGVALKVGQSVTVHFEGTFPQPSVEAQVVRSTVAAMTSSGIRYHVGLGFKSRLALDDESAPESGSAGQAAPARAASQPTANPVINRW